VNDQYIAKSKALPISLVIQSILFAGSCGPKQQGPQEQCLDSVTIPTDCSNLNAKYVCVKKGGKVIWEEAGTSGGNKKDFLVRFKKDTPLRIYGHKRFEVASKLGSGITEEVIIDLNATSKTYHYDLECNNSNSADPMIKVP
jgi:hypothetical protein